MILLLKGSYKVIMRRRSIIKTVLMLMLAFTVIFTSVAASSVPSYAASKKVKSKSYSQVIVKKNTAYCIAGSQIKKVNLKTGKVKTLFKTKYVDGAIKSMMLKKGNLYFVISYSSSCELYRVKISNKKVTKIDSGLLISKVGVSGKKLYYTVRDYDDKAIRKCAALNGKNKKKTKVKVTEKKYKTTNKKYKVTHKYVGEDDDENFIYQFKLVKPGKDINLGKCACDI